jgi:cytochrome P450
MGAELQIEDFDDPTYDPHTEANSWGENVDFWKDMQAAWDKNGPVHPGDFRELAGLSEHADYPEGQKTYLVFGTELIRSILNDPETYSMEHFKVGFKAAFGNSLTQMDPPEHTQYRRIFQKVFLPNAIRHWSDTLVEPVVQELIDKFKDRDRVELIQAFTFPYPFEIIYRQLEFPVGQRATFHKLAVAQSIFQSNMEIASEAGRKLGNYFSVVLEERKKKPGTDLVSLLAQVEVDGEHLPDDVIISFLRQLINAAGDTTYRSTSNMMVCLLRDNPDQWKLLVKDRSLIRGAIEETIRLHSPVGMAMRKVMRDVELEGVKIAKGSIVETANILVGRDPAIFPDPHKFDITREHPERHMGFSNGPHVCLGQHLARLEMTRALNALLDHFPDMRLDEDYPPPVISGHLMLCPKELRVRLR